MRKLQSLFGYVMFMVFVAVILYAVVGLLGR